MGHAWSENKILTHYPAAVKLYEAIIMKKNIAFPPPRFVSIWISEVCNLDCTYCYFADTNHDPERKFIDTNEIIRWLAEMKEFGAEALEFSGGGEPTVHKDFAKIFKTASDMKYAIGLITHGCNPMPIELLVNHAKYVRVGLDAATQETHERIKRKQGKFKAALDNIKALVKLRNELKSKTFTVGVKVVLNAINFQELSQIMDLAMDLEVDYLQVKYEHSSDNKLSDESLSFAQILMNNRDKFCQKQKLKTRIFGNVRHERAVTQCFMSPIHTVVTAMGEILQCCFYGPDRPIGTIRQPIREIWGEQKHREIIAKTSVTECDKVDCRWNGFNSKMKEIIEDPLRQDDFI